MNNISLYILLGIVAGIISGLVGIGGGVIITPALIILFGLSQHQAQGTTLTLLAFPVGSMAAWAYYQKGFVDIRIAAFMCVGFLFGSLVGAKIAINVSDAILGKFFGATMLIISLKMIFMK